MSRGDVRLGRLRTDDDRRRALRKIERRINEIESSVIHQGDGVASIQGGPQRLKIVSGRITASRNDHLLEAETGTTDILTGIDGGELGQVLVLGPWFTHQITVVDQGAAGSRKMYLDNQLDFLLLGSSQTRLFLYRAVDAWYELGRLPGYRIPRSPTPVSGNVTLDSTHDLVLCSALGGAFTVTLPAAADQIGQSYDIKKVDSSANAVTIDGDGSETIDGSTTKVLAIQYDSATVVSDGSNWHVI